MRFDVPFEVHYLTPGTVPIEDVIDGLLAAKLLIEEGGYNLSNLVPGLHIEQVSVIVRSITQESPLREILFAAIYLTTQKDLEREVPAMIELLSGTQVPENFKTIVTLSVLIALFYGAAYVKDLVAHVTTDSKIKKQLNAMIKDLSGRTGQTEDQIKKFLDERYKPKNKLKILGEAAFKFFKPSKSQSDSPIRVNDREISHDLVSDVPQSYAL
jgi:cell division protein FtsB